MDVDNCGYLTTLTWTSWIEAPAAPALPWTRTLQGIGILHHSCSKWEGSGPGRGPLPNQEKRKREFTVNEVDVFNKLAVICLQRLKVKCSQREWRRVCESIKRSVSFLLFWKSSILPSLLYDTLSNYSPFSHISVTFFFTFGNFSTVTAETHAHSNYPALNWCLWVW